MPQPCPDPDSGPAGQDDVVHFFLLLRADQRIKLTHLPADAAADTLRSVNHCFLILILNKQTNIMFDSFKDKYYFLSNFLMLMWNMRE